MTEQRTTPAGHMGEADLGLLIALEAMLQDNNVTHAAARLGLSQPALSARLSRLRLLFDDPLFVPASNGRGMVPTPRALNLREGLSGTLELLRGMLRTSGEFNPTTSTRTFVLAMQEQPAAVLAPGLVQAVQAAAPMIRTAFVYPGPDVDERLEDGSIDLLVAPSSQASITLMARALFDNDFLTAHRIGHPRGTGPFDLDAFCALDHLVVSTDGGGFAGLVDRTLAGMGRTRRVALSIQSYSLAPLIVAKSDCVCTLPARLLQPYANQLVLLEPPLRLPRPQLMALWHARSQTDEGHVWLREQLYRVAESTV